MLSKEKIMKKLLLAILFIVFTFTVVACDVPMTGSGLGDGGSSDSGESGDGEIVTQVTEEEWNKAFSFEGIPSYEVFAEVKAIDKYGYVERIKQKGLVVGQDFAIGHIQVNYENGEVEDEEFELEEIQFDEYFDVTSEECYYYYKPSRGWCYEIVSVDDIMSRKPNFNAFRCSFEDASYNEEEGCYEYRIVLDEEGYEYRDIKTYFENLKLVKLVIEDKQEEGEVSGTITVSYGDYKLYFPKDAQESDDYWRETTGNGNVTEEEEANGQESQQESESMIEEEIIEN